MSFNKSYALDGATGLVKREPALAALAADGYVGTQHDQLSATATDMVLVLNVESIVTNGATGETYKLYVIGSNVAKRSDGEVLVVHQLGKASQLTGSQKTSHTIAGACRVVQRRTYKTRTQLRYVGH